MSTQKATPDVLVVGAGVMGCGVALRLAQAGLEVTVLERSVPGAEASSAAAGILGPMMEADHSSARELSLRLGLRSRALHYELARELREEHDLEYACRATGLLRVARNDAERASLDAHASWLRATAMEEVRGVVTLDGEEARRREPSLGECVAALELPGEGQLDPKRLLPALSIAAERAGARFRTGATVRGILHQGGRALGVRLDSGELHAGHVIVAAGSWTSLVPGIPLPSQTIAPVKGQVLRTRARPRVFERVVFGGGGYVVTRADGEVLVGATTERVGFERGVTLEGLAQLISIATTLAPRLSGAKVLNHWAGFRPGTPDDLPLVGATDISGLWLASGHYRNGILLAPLTARLIADAILGAPVDADARALSPTRFSDSP